MNNLEKWFPLISIILVAISYFLHKKIKANKAMTLNETLSNVTIFLIWKYIFFIGGEILQFSIYNYFSKFSIFSFKNSTIFFILSIFIVDFFYYWKHRFEHEIPFFWAQHAVHHNSREFNFSTSLRLPWIGSYLTWVFFLPLVFIGFSPLQIIMAYKVILTYQYLIHTEYIKNLGVFEKIFNTPSNHRVHHGRNKIYLDKNYGGIFIIWDILFKTYIPEIESVQYGTTKELKSKSPLMVNLQPWQDLLKYTKKRNSLVDKCRYLFLPPTKKSNH